MTTLIGVVASVLTTMSYLPQLTKAWRTGQTGDLSLTMLCLLLAGLLLWVLYGVLRADIVVLLANSASSALLATLIVLKLRAPSA
nr:SemiSWEET family transporter [Ancylobacter gelatini]